MEESFIMQLQWHRMFMVEKLFLVIFPLFLSNFQRTDGVLF